ncbi:MAG TPA: hypothetical protein ENK75_03565 [Saprospiraceae bacterium]|nr:hypothetical protein [Saprospiraceae bacterium]
MAKKYLNKIVEINYFENPHVFTHTSSTIVSRKVFDKVVGGFPAGMKKNEDYALFFSVALFAKTVYSGFPMSYYFANVDFQATQVLIDDYDDVVKRLNLTFQLWNNLGRNDDFFLIFFKYEFRHFIFGFLKNNEYGKINDFLMKLDENALKTFSQIELFMYENKFFKYIAIYYIIVTKLIWRKNGFPKVGE